MTFSPFYTLSAIKYQAIVRLQFCRQREPQVLVNVTTKVTRYVCDVGEHLSTFRRRDVLSVLIQNKG